MEQAIHHILASRDIRDRLADSEKDPEDPHGEVNTYLRREEDPRARTREKEEVAATRVMEEEN